MPLKSRSGDRSPYCRRNASHPLLVAGGQFLIQRSAVEGLAEQFRDFPAHVVDGLAHLDRLAAVRRRIEQQCAAAGIDLDLQRDAELAAIAENGLMMAGHARRAAIPVQVLIEFADLARAVGHLELCASRMVQLRPPTRSRASSTVTVVAGFAEFVCGREARDAGAEHDDLGGVGVASFKRQRFGGRRDAQAGPSPAW